MADLSANIVRGHGPSQIMAPPGTELSRVVSAESVRLSQTASASVGANIIFTEDFEVATMEDLRAKGWPWIGPIDGGCPDYCTISLVSSTSLGAAPHGGSKMLLLEYRGPYINLDGESVHNSAIWRPLPLPTEFYMRYWYRTEVNTLNVDGTTNPNPPAESTYFEITSKQHYIKSYDGYPNVVANHYWGSRELVLDFQGAVIWVDPTPNMARIPLQDNQWYCVEYHVKWNTPDVANGVEEIWVDGVQTRGLYDRLFLDAAHATGAFIGIDIFAQGAHYMNRYEDDMVMSTTRIGCG